jgi:hypothetical protein
MIADSGSTGGFLHRALHSAADIGRSTILNYVEYRLPGAADALGALGVRGWTAYARLWIEPWRAAVSERTRRLVAASAAQAAPRATPERGEGERDGRCPPSGAAPRLSACGPRPCRA